MTMPGAEWWDPMGPGIPTYFGANLTAAVNNGSVTESRLNDMVLRVMAPYFFLGQDKDDFPLLDPSMGAYPQVNSFNSPAVWLSNWTDSLGSSDRDVRGNHSSLVRELGAAGTVLLKNTNHALPLKAPKRIGIFGNAAGDLTTGPYYSSSNFEYGFLSAGGGSGTGRFSQSVSPLEALKARGRQDKSLVQYILNNTQLVNGGYASVIYPPPDVCLVFLKTWGSEGEDRTTLHVDWDGDEVVAQVASNCSNTVVITQATGLNVMPWADHENVTAILATHLAGDEIGNSLVDILYGQVNPSGCVSLVIVVAVISISLTLL
jgi:beta-glucosidase